MARDQIKIAFVQEMVFDSAHHHGSVALAHLGNHHPMVKLRYVRRERAKEIWAAVKFARRCEDAVLGFLRDGVGNGGAIDDQRDGGGRESEVLGELLKADWLADDASGSIAGGLQFPWAHPAKSRTRKTRRQAQK